MAEIVLGIGASHSPQVSTTWEQWPNMRRTEERSPTVPANLDPPNQPTPKRSYQLGAAVRRSIEEWDGGARIAVIASGGLSHIVLDEPLDRAVLAGLQAHDPEQLYAVPRAKLRGGTSEILNWIALGGAVGPMKMTLIDYVAGYRSMPSTGCGMAFAYWTQA